MKTLVDEIAEKYLGEPASLGFNCRISVTGSPTHRHISVPFKGAEDVGDTGKISGIVKDCEELDVTANSLRLTSVPTLVGSFQHLKVLNLSENNLGGTSPTPEIESRNGTLRTLVLNNCQLDWESLTWLLDFFEHLETLHLDSNGLDFAVRIGKKPYSSIRALHFLESKISSQESLKALSDMFPALKDLYLRGTLCNDVWTEIPEGILPCVEKLSLTESGIADWKEVDALNALPSLKHLKIARCPVFEGLSEDIRRQLLIARLPKLITLNGGVTITADEREKAERSFLRYYMERSEKPSRYFDLEVIHGRLQKLVEINLSPKKIVTVVIKREEVSLTKQINIYKTVSDLKRTLEPVIGLSAKKMRLYYVDRGMVGAFGPDELKVGTKQLYTLHLKDGDEFIVEEKQ